MLGERLQPLQHFPRWIHRVRERRQPALSTCKMLTWVQSEVDPNTDWEDPTKLRNLLQWKSEPMVQLFWTRAHMKTLDPLRRSTEGLAIDPTSTSLPDLNSRVGISNRCISLYRNPFSGTQTLQAWQPPLRAASAMISRLIVHFLPWGTLPAFQQSSSIPVPLSSYPNFIYFESGKPLFPKSAISSWQISRTISNGHILLSHPGFNRGGAVFYIHLPGHSARCTALQIRGKM